MKKLIISLLCIGLFTNSISAISLVRAWECRPSAPKTNCSQADRDAAKKWFRNAKIGALSVLAAALAALGLIVGMSQLQKEKEIAIQSKPTNVVPQERKAPVVIPSQVQQPTQVEPQKSPQLVKLLEEAREDLNTINESIADWQSPQYATASPAQKSMIANEIKDLQNQKKALESQIRDLENQLKS